MYQAYPFVKVRDGNTELCEGLKSYIKEADERIVPHIDQAAKSGYQRALVLANDTEIFLLLLHYMDEFENCGVKEVWMEKWSRAFPEIYTNTFLVSQTWEKCYQFTAKVAHIDWLQRNK